MDDGKAARINETTASDAQLLRASSRDPEVFGVLYDRHAEAIYRWARGQGLGEADAVDLIGELFARAWSSRARYRDPGDGGAAPWLFGIARNLIAAHRRSGQIESRMRRRLRMPIVAEADQPDAIDERLDALASRHDLDSMLGALPESHRDAIRLRVVDELDYPQIARQLGCSEATARQWVSRGLTSLRRRMDATR